MRSGETSNGKKPNHDQSIVSKIALSIKSQDGDEVYYRFPRDKKLQHLFTSYCRQKKLSYDAIAFVYDGRRVKASKTPLEMEMEDGDSIDAMMHQDGGGYALVIT
ncbi:small ubiquitin-related modifier 2-like [Sesamum indicum]|uniref:Small ubiquitin-related modifier 2-like n=1 Tax=Sesamum indicum TaxID=4182 RepID=A0A6I9TYU6_SESIN|nr:small ubiquitin-related modifier 2-like [Sesamum indicum]